MNIIVSFQFIDENPYSVVLNLDALGKSNPKMKKLVSQMKTRLNQNKEMEVNYSCFEDIWEVWEMDEVKPSFPMMVSDSFTLYEKE